MGSFSFEFQAKVGSLLTVMSQCVASAATVTSSDKPGGPVEWGGKAFWNKLSLSSTVWEEAANAFGRSFEKLWEVKGKVNKIYYLPPQMPQTPKKVRPQSKAADFWKGKSSGNKYISRNRNPVSVKRPSATRRNTHTCTHTCTHARTHVQIDYQPKCPEMECISRAVSGSLI